MIRRLASRLGRDKKQEGQVNGVSPEANGVNGKRKSAVATSKPKETEDHSADRGDVETTFSKFAQLIHASNRPLPNQTGDGSYLAKTEPSSLMQDIRSLGFKDASTLMQVVKSKATGELQDDKTMMMEHVIQVSCALKLEAGRPLTRLDSLLPLYLQLPKPVPT